MDSPQPSLVMNPSSISADVELRPYWNDACAVMQSNLWLPQEDGSQKAASHLSSEKPAWRKVTATRGLDQPCLSVSLPPSVQAMAAREVIAARKVRVYPKDDKQWLDLCSLHRRAYNLAIETINNGKPNQVQLRIQIREQVKQERSESGRIFIPTVCDEAVNLAFDTLRKCVKKWKKGEKAKLRFRSIKDGRQGFIVQKCAAGGQIFQKYLGEAFISEVLDGEVKGQMVRVILENGRWFVSYKQTLLTESQGGDRPAAIDPGVRTFTTVYGRDDVVKYGDGFQDVLKPLQSKLDSYISLRQKLWNMKSDAQWVKDRLRNIQKKIWKLSNRISDLIDDLHRRVAYDLVKNHDVLLLPRFETSQMSAKDGKRKINKKTVRRMLTMSHFKFAQMLSWMCLKYGKTLIRVNEAYTSKTDSRTGEVKDIGGSRTINGFDRDTNGARGIMLRALSKAACA